MPESHSTDKVNEEEKTPEKEVEQPVSHSDAPQADSKTAGAKLSIDNQGKDQEMADTTVEPPSSQDVEMGDSQKADIQAKPTTGMLEPEPKFDNKNISQAMALDEEMIDTSQALITDSYIEQNTELEDLEKSELSESMGFDPAFGHTLSLDAMRGMANIPQRQGRSESIGNPILTSFWKNNESLYRNLNSEKDYMKLEDRGFIRHLMLEGNYDKVMEIMQEKYQNVLNIDPRIKESIN